MTWALVLRIAELLGPELVRMAEQYGPALSGMLKDADGDGTLDDHVQRLVRGLDATLSAVVTLHQLTTAPPPKTSPYPGESARGRQPG